jgi:hypothetical protein
MMGCPGGSSWHSCSDTTHERPAPIHSLLLLLLLLPQLVCNGCCRCLQSVAGILFFWSFELLVFLILLNFLLAIIVDAFGEVKEQQKEQTGARCLHCAIFPCW